MSATTYRDMLQVAIEEAGVLLPKGYDSWGITSVHPDLRTNYCFRWAPPGGLNLSVDRLDSRNRSAHPSHPGDGLCVATTWRGMVYGGITARTLLLVAYRAADVVGRDDRAGGLRIGGVVASVALVDGERLVREHGKNANIQCAHLRGAYLRGADLPGADLQEADLRDADLRYADLHGTRLWCAYLRGAYLRGAYLRDADLRYADLRDADLRYADLQGARWTIGVTPPSGWTLTTTGTLTRTGGAS